MRTFQQVSTLRAFMRAVREDRKSVGFVPTMGALHEGHLSLIRRARGDCDVVVVSIFVNPTQFGANEDFSRYPRDLSRDSRLTQEAGADALFYPDVDEVYPSGFQTFIEAPYISRLWEGERRPGHFRGVATICVKLFQIVQPDRAYFGMKDYQQLKVIERVVSDLNIPLTVVPCSTIREPDGLAMSSRNVYLDESSRRSSLMIHSALKRVEELYEQGEWSASVLERAMHDILRSDPAIQIDYAVIVDSETLEPIECLEKKGVALVAVRIGNTRLIDNAVLGGKLALPVKNHA
jgi:pantoate--beta-alanine ligase